MNNKLTKVIASQKEPLDAKAPRQIWDVKKWMYLEPGDIVKLEQDFEVPADIMILQSSNKSGVVFVDTMNLDGETNLKEKYSMNENFNEEILNLLKGEILCEAPNENLEKWEA